MHGRGVGAAESSVPISPDVIDQTRRPQVVPASRPEQTKSAHDKSSAFDAASAKPASDVSNAQPIRVELRDSISTATP
jgi:hypothetical protein